MGESVQPQGVPSTPITVEYRPLADPTGRVVAMQIEWRIGPQAWALATDLDTWEKLPATMQAMVDQVLPQVRAAQSGLILPAGQNNPPGRGGAPRNGGTLPPAMDHDSFGRPRG